MREVLKWNKNYETGEEVKVKCLKDRSDLRGTAKIQVFDSEGNLKNETVTENYIREWLGDDLLYRIKYIALCENLGTQLVKYTSESSDGFGCIYLTTNSDDENVDDLNIKGDIIGYCPRDDQNSGSDPARGAYNAIESFVEKKDGYYHAHLVYDFGTSQANGTFQSIYWKRKSKVYDKKGNKIGTVVKLHEDICRNYIKEDVKIGVDGIYKIKDGDWYKVVNGYEYINGYAEEAILSIEKDYFSPKYCAIKDTHYIKTSCIGIEEDTNNGTYCPDSVIKLINAKTGQEEHSITFNVRDWCPKFSVSKKMRVVVAGGDEFGNVIVVAHFYSTGNFPSYAGIFESSSSTYITMIGVYNVFEHTWQLEVTPTNKNCVVSAHWNASNEIGPYFEGSNGIVFGRYALAYVSSNRISCLDRTEPIDITNLKKSWYTISPSVLAENSTDLFVIGGAKGVASMPDSYIFVGQNSADTARQHTKIIPFTSHTKLPNPITKTSADTMKIQYDYYIQMPLMVPINGSYLPEIKPAGE